MGHVDGILVGLLVGQAVGFNVGEKVVCALTVRLMWAVDDLDAPSEFPLSFTYIVTLTTPTKPAAGLTIEFARAVLISASVPENITLELPSFVRETDAEDPAVKVARLSQFIITVIVPLPASASVIPRPEDIVRLESDLMEVSAGTLAIGGELATVAHRQHGYPTLMEYEHVNENEFQQYEFLNIQWSEPDTEHAQFPETQERPQSELELPFPMQDLLTVAHAVLHDVPLAPSTYSILL